MLVQFDHEDNKIHRDFEVYSTEIDLAKKRNEWKTIAQDQPAGSRAASFRLYADAARTTNAGERT